MQITENLERGVIIVKVSGKIENLSDTARFFEAFLSIPDERSDKIVLDLSGLLSYTPPWLGTLSNCRNHIVTHRGHLVLVGREGDAHLILKRAGLRGLVRSFGSVSEAIDHLNFVHGGLA